MSRPRPAARGRRIWSAVAVVAAGLLTAGCFGLPNSSTPQTIGTFNRQSANQIVPPPQSGLAPDQLLQGFLDASTVPDGMHAQARQYLTREAAKKWDDTTSTAIVDDTVVQQQSRNATHATFLVHATKVGQLQEGGVYRPDSGSFQAQISLSYFGSEWRIDQLPNGVILKRDQFQNAYHQYALYFLNPADTALVPDMRWIAGGRDNLASELVAKLLVGPSLALAPAVKNEFAGGVSLNQLARTDGRSGPIGVGLGGIRMDFHGAGALDQRDRELLAAQVYWTLQAAGESGPYQLLADGKPLDQRFPADWPADNVLALDPHPANDSSPLNAVLNGALATVNDNSVSPVPGFFGTTSTLRSASLSYDRKVVAAVAAAKGSGQQQLLVGGYGGNASPVTIGTAITRPTWSMDSGSVWAVVNGTKVVRAVRDPSTGITSNTEVDATQLTQLGGPITELRLSRDGVRAAVIVNGKVYVAVVEIGQGGRYTLTNPWLIPIKQGANAVSLDWDPGGVVLLVSEDSDTPLVQVSADGSSLQPFKVLQNLTPPVRVISATPSMYYVQDSRTILYLRNDATGADDHYWREITPLAGYVAVPVVPG